MFFSNCNLSCIFCQNYPISQLGNGYKVSVRELSEIMIELQGKGVHNINLVTPTHVIPYIVYAFFEAKEKGLKIPLVYNCGGYESIETLKLLKGIIDIYLPDAKYSNDEDSLKCSGVKNYFKINRVALKEMYDQAGNLVLDKYGIAKKGLIIRHLVLPQDLSGTKHVLEFISNSICKDTYLSLMSQYHPAHKVVNAKELSKKITKKAYNSALETANELGLTNGWKQDL
ncbi:radical SAM protein [Elusimicrobiota bacterium]